MDEVTLDAFRLFAQWLYSQGFDLILLKALAKRDRRRDNPDWEQHGLWMFGKMAHMSKLQNSVMLS